MDWTHGDILEVMARLLAAAAMGSLVGFDRELRGKPAGLRTHALVSLGAAVVVVISGRLAPVLDTAAISRAIQGIIAGVGFLGAGTILKTEGTEENVHGLTTAASIWVVAALGIACGAGQWVASLIAAAITLLILILGVPVERFFRKKLGQHPE